MGTPKPVSSPARNLPPALGAVSALCYCFGMEKDRNILGLKIVERPDLPVGEVRLVSPGEIQLLPAPVLPTEIAVLFEEVKRSIARAYGLTLD